MPVEIRPAQLPHPPFWYAVPVPDGAAWPAQNRINIVCGGPLPRVREITDRYRADGLLPAMRPRGCRCSINRFVVAADTDAEAMTLGRRAWPLFYASFMKLWIKHGTQPRFARIPPDSTPWSETAARWRDRPIRIRDQVRNMAGEAGASYFISQFSFGDLSPAEVLHSARHLCARGTAGVAVGAAAWSYPLQFSTSCARR